MRGHSTWMISSTSTVLSHMSRMLKRGVMERSVHDTDKPHMGTYCGERFVLLTHGSMNKNTRMPSTSVNYAREFRSKKSLHCHTNSIHENSHPFIHLYVNCAANQLIVDLHYKLKSSTLTLSLTLPYGTCRICTKGYLHLQSFQSHMLSCKNELISRYSSTICCKTFKGSSACKPHGRRLHEDVNWHVNNFEWTYQFMYYWCCKQCPWFVALTPIAECFSLQFIA